MSLITYQEEFSEQVRWFGRCPGNMPFTSFLAAAVDNFQEAAWHSDFASTSPSDRSLLKAKQPSCWCRYQWQKQEICTDRDRLREMQKYPEKPNSTRIQSQLGNSQVKTHSTTVSHNCKFKWKWMNLRWTRQKISSKRMLLLLSLLLGCCFCCFVEQVPNALTENLY